MLVIESLAVVGWGGLTGNGDAGEHRTANLEFR